MWSQLVTQDHKVSDQYNLRATQMETVHQITSWMNVYKIYILHYKYVPALLSGTCTETDLLV